MTKTALQLNKIATNRGLSVADCQLKTGHTDHNTQKTSEEKSRPMMCLNAHVKAL